MAIVSKLVQRTGPYGLYALARFVCRRQPRILMYHRFSDIPRDGFASREVFREQVAHIRRYYNPMTIRDLSHALFEQGRVPNHAVVLTIDDGYRDFYDIAYPILKEHDVPATFFVTTGFINGDLWLWHDQVRWLLDQIDSIGDTFSIGPVSFREGALSDEFKTRLWQQLSNFLLTIDDDEKHRVINYLAKSFGQNLADSAPQGYEPCNWGQLREMEAWGIEIGGHTVSHPSLGCVSIRQARDEIFGSMKALQDELKHRSRSFCYPNGQFYDYPRESMKLVEEAGFVAATVAFSDREGVMQRYALRRHGGGDNRFQFAKAVSGIEYIGSRLGRS